MLYNNGFYFRRILKTGFVIRHSQKKILCACRRHGSTLHCLFAVDYSVYGRRTIQPNLKKPAPPHIVLYFLLSPYVSIKLLCMLIHVFLFCNLCIYNATRTSYQMERRLEVRLRCIFDLFLGTSS